MRQSRLTGKCGRAPPAEAERSVLINSSVCQEIRNSNEPMAALATIRAQSGNTISTLNQGLPNYPAQRVDTNERQRDSSALAATIVHNVVNRVIRNPPARLFLRGNRRIGANWSESPSLSANIIRHNKTAFQKARQISLILPALAPPAPSAPSPRTPARPATASDPGAAAATPGG